MVGLVLVQSLLMVQLVAAMDVRWGRCHVLLLVM